MKREVFRIIDANLNRSREGLRVCEEVSRFILRSPKMTAELKSVRHAISTIVKDLSARSQALLESRDARGDIGKQLLFEGETQKSDCADIFSANIERVKESLRVLEEFFKLVDPNISARVLVLRFKVYDIEKKALKKIASLRNPG
jgi:thiamine-phosphate pyrophosphorylase